ncbi:Hypothetical predicted protein [Marmota monax]|uniref:Uncharacterized protein n=1 Tax=Marmota monax TaxID=9995 RepID=A0A5E4BQP6_MARMO|nr:hypothetical protein GHT09_010548 [Marmota monax]VTJ71974.1 Hypothetical predicted protein [Marmota monax]
MTAAPIQESWPPYPHRSPGLSISTGCLATRPCRTSGYLRRTISISTLTGLLAAHLCRNPSCYSHIGHPATAHAQNPPVATPMWNPFYQHGAPLVASILEHCNHFQSFLHAVACTQEHCTGSVDSCQP